MVINDKKKKLDEQDVSLTTWVLVGLVLGLMFGGAWCYIMDYRQETVTDQGQTRQVDTREWREQHTGRGGAQKWEAGIGGPQKVEAWIGGPQKVEAWIGRPQKVEDEIGGLAKVEAGTGGTDGERVEAEISDEGNIDLLE